MWNLFRRFKVSRGKKDLTEFGPEYGVDYARFSDPPDENKDALLSSQVLQELETCFSLSPSRLKIFVRNGFVFIKLFDRGDVLREDIRLLFSRHKSVRDVIIQVETLEASEELPLAEKNAFPLTSDFPERNF